MSTSTQFKFTPAHECILTAREQKVSSASQKHKNTAHWPEEDTKVIIALICKLDRDHTRQQIAEEYLTNYVVPGDDWHPELQAVLNKVKWERQVLARAARRRVRIWVKRFFYSRDWAYKSVPSLTIKL
ncbi:hypothetical protein HK097_006140 [Rhizophlyctis rosea]|uniref:Uncharacterized protein n=1 Tax=Rhizophlyctis rosea TaxID=64517 RepID=A0AAD5SG46_9FUNG|nr:hypothetical protein HK097_006140 [Rhizophlyctis rosea]